ncbi:hypothetical protein AQ622_00603 [Pseudomonas aeruginosa]|nr:hypothetical protein AQ622_00603 [Pseudomonas aeruginosa]EZN65450.1 hypothetical protein AJ72_01962 [Pseudomonas aeruginosa BWH032]MDA1396319.1 hypothetical protein [Pseudomonas aeruginosa]
MSDTVIVRRRVESNFTTLPNELIRDNRLSWKAVGLLVYLLAHPANFRLNLVYLAKQRPSGRDATRSALRELEATGYVSIERSHDSRGRFSTTTWMVSQTPDFGRDPPCSGNPHTVNPAKENPKAESPASGKPTLISIETEQRSIRKRTTTTMPAVGALERPVGLTDRYWAAIEEALAALPLEDAQALLDELAQAIKVGAIKTTPLRWFHGVMRRYAEGRFTPSLPLKQRTASLSRTSTGPSTKPEPDRGIANECLQQMKATTSRVRLGQ